jgi:hypothetical protein
MYETVVTGTGLSKPVALDFYSDPIWGARWHYDDVITI